MQLFRNAFVRRSSMFPFCLSCYRWIIFLLFILSQKHTLRIICLACILRECNNCFSLFSLHNRILFHLCTSIISYWNTIVNETCQVYSLDTLVKYIMSELPQPEEGHINKTSKLFNLDNNGSINIINGISVNSGINWFIKHTTFYSLQREG
jgi:hypothetical protein